MRYDEPLGLPKGSVRGILTLLLVFPVPVMVILASFGHSAPGEIVAFYSAIVLSVVKDYFGDRRVTGDTSEDSDYTDYTVTGDE